MQLSTAQKIIPILLFFPQLAAALSTNDAVGLFNIFVGVMVVCAFLAYIVGFIVYAVRLGTDQRVQGIRIMEWGVAILFVLVVILALIHYFQVHPQAATLVLSAIVALIIVTVIFMIATDKPAAPEKEER